MTLTFKVYDQLTNQTIPGSCVTFKSLSDTIGSTKNITNITFDGNFAIDVPHIKSKYLVSVVAEKDAKIRTSDAFKPKFDYDPVTFTLDLTDLKPDEYKRVLPDVYLHRHVERKLDEVTVTASKVKFYYKGDTLVYNADAFITAQGSMLDALLKQLPGVELKRGGEITVNGKRVESLLLNGKDLFDGDRQLMLNNIGAYTVKNINLYYETGRDSELLGFDVGDRKYVMDVRLKRQYSQGFNLTAEGGLGNNGRYSGKLFGLWFSEFVSMSAFGTVNNLNDVSQPGDGGYSVASLGDFGTNTTRAGGLTYHAEGGGVGADRWKINGRTKLTDLRTYTLTSTFTRNFLTAGDTYKYSWYDSRNRSINLTSVHKAEFGIKRKANVTLDPEFEWSKRDADYDYLSATLDAELEPDSARQIIEAAYTGGSLGTARLLNRMRQEQSARTDRVRGVMKARVVTPTGERSWITLTAYGRMLNFGTDTWQKYALAFGSDAGGAQTMLRHFDATPNRDREAYAMLNWRMRLKEESYVGLQYFESVLAEKRRFDVAGLDFDGAGAGDSISVDMLPSMAESMANIAGQSYCGDYLARWHTPFVELLLKNETPATVRYLKIEVPVKFASRHYEYKRAGRVQYVASSSRAPDLYLHTYYKWKRMRGQTTLSLTARSQVGYAQLSRMVEVTDDTDPLNVRLGNPGLKDYRTNSAKLSFSIDKSINNRHEASVNFSSTDNAIASGYYYTPTTGVRTTRAYNVDGNFNVNGSYKISKSFKMPPGFAVSSLNPTLSVDGGYSRSIGLVGTTTTSTPDFDVAPPKRRIGTGYANTRLNLSTQIGKTVMLRALATLGLRRYSSDDPGFTGFTSRNGQYYIDGTVKCPHNWDLQTDLTLYTRHGYSDDRLNTSDLVWNAGVSKSVMRGRIVLSLKGYDLLRQLTNISYTINAQARTETVSNVVPAYFMLSATYRWNRQPAK